MKRSKAMAIMERTKKSYELIAREFSDTRERVWPEMETLVKKYVRKGMRVLDVGCGNGRLVGILSEVDYVGVDSSRSLVEQAKKEWPGRDFREMDILELDKLKGKFDIVFCFASFNHLAGRDYRVRVLKNVKSLLDPEGLLIMTNWNMWQWGAKKSVWRVSFPRRDVLTLWQGPGGKKEQLYYRAFSLRELGKLLKKSGFLVVENYYSLKGKRASWLRGRNIVSVAKSS